MKKNITTLFLLVSLITGFALTNANAQCLDWLAPTPANGWTDFNNTFGGAPCDDGTGCPFNEIQAFEVFASEAYALAGVMQGGTYEFSVCNGPNAGTWVPEFTIIAPSGAVDAFGPGTGCAISWTASEAGEYLLVINEAGQCGGGSNTGTPNGFPAITCTTGASCQTGCEAGTLLSATVDTLCAFETITAINSTPTIPTSGTHGLFFSNSQGGTGALEANFILPGAPDTFEFDFDLNGILSFNNLAPLAGTWVIYSSVSSNANDAFNTLCSLSADSMVITFSDMYTIDLNDNGDGTVTANTINPAQNPSYDWSNGQTTQTATGFMEGDTAAVVATDGYGCQVQGETIVTFGGGNADSCTVWLNPSPTGGWIDFNNTFGGAPCDDGTGCPFNEIQAFEVWASEAYSVDNFIAGGTYAFSMCNGAGAGSWVPEFTIIAPSGAIDAFGPGDGDGCTITWTASEDGTYLIVVNEAGQCGGGPNIDVDNGFPALTCLGGAVCPLVPCSAGELTSTVPQIACGPDATITVSTDGTEDIPGTGGHGWAFSDELGGTGGVAGGFTLTAAPLTEDYNSDLNGVLSSNMLPVLEGPWVIRSVAYSNANAPIASICSVSTDSLIVVFAAEGPSVTVVDNGNSTATASATGGALPYTYLWSNGQTTATASNLPTGNYSVVVTDVNGCTSSATVAVVSSVRGIESLKALSISPNPTNGMFVVQIELGAIEAIDVKILDVTGKEVARDQAYAAQHRFSFDLSQQPSGIYMLKTTVGGGTAVNRLVLTK